MNALPNLENESPDTSKTSSTIPGDGSERDWLPRGSGLGLKTIEMLQRQILEADSLEAAKDLAKAAQREVLEILRRYTRRREQLAPQGAPDEIAPQGADRG